MTYNPGRIVRTNPETEKQEINPGLTQMQFNEISSETKLLQENINKENKRILNLNKRFDRPRFSRIFMHL